MVRPFRTDLGALFALLLIGCEVRAQTPVLEFLAPTNNAIFSILDEIPVKLRAVASNDVFLAAEITDNFHLSVGTATYCCPVCRCIAPVDGQETILQIPDTGSEGETSGLWRGWRRPQAGTHRLTAKATGQKGTLVEATPVTITVVDTALHAFFQQDGTVTLSIPQGSLVEGGYDLEVSEDLRTWTRLGEFSPGAVAAFYWDTSGMNARRARFYRSVYVRR